MIIRGVKTNYTERNSGYKKLGENNVSFSGKNKYKVVGKNKFKSAVPVIAFLSSIIGATGYFMGGAGLFYDIYKDKQNKIKKTEKKEDGVKTIVANTKIAQIGMNCAKVGIAASSVANIACGIGEGIPLMALGEVPNLASAKIIETPIGTGLFGIGIASIFAGLALDNTPHLKLNELDLMAEKSLSKKTKLILKNTWDAAKETVISMGEICTKPFKEKGFLKKAFLELNPKTVVFSESINKEGKVVLSKMLRHQKNYLMNAASFVLTMGGVGIIATSILNMKKAQEVSLKVEEGGFLFDNFGITKYGIDKLSTGSKSAGASFAIGGVANAISQFLGLDNKEGRALQWLGIGGVFLGYAIDRGRFLKTAIKNAKFRPELTRVVREWSFDLTNLIKDKKELKKLQSEIKKGQPITNADFNKLEKALNKSVGKGKIRSGEKIKQLLSRRLGKNVSGNIKGHEIIKDFEKDLKNKVKSVQKTLETCSEKLFGKNPTPIKEAA